MMPSLPQIWIYSCLQLGPFFLIYFLLRRGGPAELQSCNFRAYKYFTGNDCGKPRKRHRLSNALSIYILCFLLLLLADGNAHYVSDDLSLFVHSTDRWAADVLIAAALVYHCKFPSQQSNTCLLFLRPTRQYLIGERGDNCSRGLNEVQLQLSVSAAPCVVLQLR